MHIIVRKGRRKASQTGVVAVEFALVALFAFFPLLLGIMEFGRFLYVSSTVQEVTRRAAREQIVRWMDQASTVQRMAVFSSASSGTATLPAGAEVTSASVSLTFFNTFNDALNNTNSISTTSVTSPNDNLNHCVLQDNLCIRFVKATLVGNGGAPIRYAPMIGIFFGVRLFSGWSVNLNVPIPGSTVIIPAESLGQTS